MDIPFDLLYIVASFIVKPRMKLLDWIPEYKQSSHDYNNNAIYILEKHPNEIDWKWSLASPSICEIDTKKMKIELTKKAKKIDV